MTYLSAKQKHHALQVVIEMAEDSLLALGNDPRFVESKWQESVSALYQVKLMRDNYNA